MPARRRRTWKVKNLSQEKGITTCVKNGWIALLVHTGASSETTICIPLVKAFIRVTVDKARPQGIRQVLPVNQVFACYMSPFYAKLPFYRVWDILEEQVIPAGKHASPQEQPHTEASFYCGSPVSCSGRRYSKCPWSA